MPKRPRSPQSRSRKPRKPREARKPRQIGGKGSIVFSFYRNTWAQIEAAARHQLLRLFDGWSRIDPARLDRNRVLLGSGDIREDIRAYERMIEVRGHLRDSAVPYLTLVLGASPEFFRPKGGEPGTEVNDPEDAARLEAWIEENMAWARETFGVDLVSAHYNGDETTPHIHLAIVPTYERRATFKPRRTRSETSEAHADRIAEWEATPTIRTRSWSSNPVVGRNNSTKLIRQEYAAAMEPLGLQYSLDSFDPKDPDDPVSQRDYQAFLENEAAQRIEDLKREIEGMAGILREAIERAARGEEPLPVASPSSSFLLRLEPVFAALSDTARAVRECDAALAERRQAVEAEIARAAQAAQDRQTESLAKLLEGANDALVAIGRGEEALPIAGDTTALPGLEPMLTSLAGIARSMRENEAAAQASCDAAAEAKRKADADERAAQEVRDAARRDYDQIIRSAEGEAAIIRHRARKEAKENDDRLRERFSEEARKALDEKKAFEKRQRRIAEDLNAVLDAIGSGGLTINKAGDLCVDGAPRDLAALGVLAPVVSRLGRSFIETRKNGRRATRMLGVLEAIAAEHRSWEDAFWRQCGKDLPPEIALMLGKNRGLSKRRQRQMERLLGWEARDTAAGRECGDVEVDLDDSTVDLEF